MSTIVKFVIKNFTIGEIINCKSGVKIFIEMFNEYGKIQSAGMFSFYGVSLILTLAQQLQAIFVLGTFIGLFFM